MPLFFQHRTSVSLLLLLPLILLLISGHSHGHTKGLRQGNQPHYSGNTTQQRLIEQQFMRWVKFVGSLRHSLFGRAMNKLFPSYTLTVDKNPAKGDFTTIQEAIDSLPVINLLRVIIKINAGTYTEKVSISAMKAFITIEGAGADKTVVQWGDTADTIGAKGQPLGTYNSATFAVNSAFFVAKNITFKNTSPVPKPGAVGKQAVAMRISGDTAAFLGCKFLGAQDTLYDHLGRHYYKDCYIEGSVDFIFGNALSLYEGCHMHAIAESIGAVTAQNRMSLLDPTGFSFVNCKVTGSGALYLGRAWGTFSRVIFAYTYMDDIIIPSGWSNWGDPNREMTVFYGQYKCSGPGANYVGRVPWSRELTDEEAKPFISLSFIDGVEWIKL
ncbi:probable pectinesterase 53 [Dendrobium catenatum]|uniref:Pectinesterase n=1 Tax=Dendrobium catenatum TaxID=906689 RepID=A0A2I0W6I9_9ASPA|nr:probable pectinesterase 53 [Dendrobium catenatum]PKU71271.1 putative pectinesterase 53 [Dendrobium catenatum]